MNRREFGKTLGITALAAQREGQAQQGDVPTLYYVDGYHGGSRGHMPAGAWRDIVNTMRATPAWKLSLDIEPASWEELRQEDPEAYREFQKWLSDPSTHARVEMVNGTFSQPFGWAHGGESNIRQIQRGSEVIREHFPGIAIDTYSVQEPCWASCLPQILRSFGFSGASLKNPGTAWGGYSAGFDAEVVEWVGPDGTSIPAVPRYACEELLQVWETESVTGSAAFSRKCVANGIPHPSGNCFQDLGWAARPKVRGSHIQFVTWREYLREVAAKPSKQWRFSIEDILTSLPWGEKTLQTAAQQVRSAENRVLVAEKMASIAVALQGAGFPTDRLRRAWDQLLWAQHHDAWITITTRSGRQAWAFQVASETMETEEISSDIIGASAAALSRGKAAAVGSPLATQWARVFNTTGADRKATVEVSWIADRGTRRARVFDSAGRELPCQFLHLRKFTPAGPASASGRTRVAGDSIAGLPAFEPGESLNAATIAFRADVPSLGYSTYRIEPVQDDSRPAASSGASGRREDDSVVLETDLYRVRLEPQRGGVISSLLVKNGNREYVDASNERLFNEYRGYFVAEKKWASSAESPATINISERGPVRVRAVVSGQILGRRFQTTITLAQGERRIDFRARFTYDQDTWIGDPWDIKPEDRRVERRRSQNDGRWKLQAFFPVPFRERAIYKNAAYDVCRSRNQDTYFQKWNEIKHNMIVHWVDVVDEQQNLGLAVFSDHTTAYTHGPDHPLALVMGWGWEGGFWFGKCPLRGTQEVGYGLVPHGGRWHEAGISRESCASNEPLIAQLVDGDPGASSTKSLVSVSGQGVEIPTLLFQEKAMLVRLFNAEGDGAERAVSLGVKPSRAELVELDGRVARTLEVRSAAGGRYEVRLAMPQFGIRTIRFELEPSTGGQ